MCEINKSALVRVKKLNDLTHDLAAMGRIVRNARTVVGSGVPQRVFAKRLNVSQASLSKYEQGKVNPPGNVVFHCMNILMGRGDGSGSAANNK